MNPVFFYYPNLIGYFRVATAIAAMYFSLTHWQLTAVLYAVSQACQTKQSDSRSQALIITSLAGPGRGRRRGRARV